MLDSSSPEVPVHVALNLIGPALVGGFAGHLDFHIAESIALHERRLVEDAQARGDRRAVFRLLRQGELRLLRPRSYRQFLEGRGPAPEIHL